MRSISNPNLSSDPILGSVTVILILVCLFVFTGIKMSDLFTPEGFAMTYNEKPWIIYLALSIALYALISIWSYQKTNKKEGFDAKPGVAVDIESEESEFDEYDRGVTMTFDAFFQKHFDLNRLMQNQDTNTEKKARQALQTSFLVLRTKINDQNYYMVMKSDTIDGIYSHIPERTSKKEVMCRICKENDRYIRPVLIREDVLQDLYDNYLSNIRSRVDAEEPERSILTSRAAVPSSASSNGQSLADLIKANLNSPTIADSSEDTVGGIINAQSNDSMMDTDSADSVNTVDHVETFLSDIGDAIDNAMDEIDKSPDPVYPRFIHHLGVNSQPRGGSLFGTENNTSSEEETPKSSYNLSGFHVDQVSDIKDKRPYLVTSVQAFSKFTTLETPDDKLFVCGSMPGRSFSAADPGNGIFAETRAPLLDDQSGDSAISEERVTDPATIESAENLFAKVNLYFINDGKKYYVSRLNGFGPRDARSTDVADTDMTSEETVESEVEESKIMYPVGLMPENYIHPEFPSDDEPNYSYAQKIDFDVMMVKLRAL